MKIKAYIKRTTGEIDRIAGDEQDPRDIPLGFRKGSTMPGGWSSCSFNLSRDAMRRDLDPYDELVVHGDGNQVLFEGYGIEYPATDGDAGSVTLQATGWGSCLKDNPCPNVVVVDRSFGSWGAPPRSRQIVLTALGATYDKGVSVTADGALWWNGESGQTIPNASRAEVTYMAPAGVLLKKLMYLGSQANATNVAAAALTAADSDGTTNSVTAALTLNSALQTATPSGSRKTFTLDAAYSAGTAVAAGSPFYRSLPTVAVYGDHGIPLKAVTGEPDGVLASDLLAWLLIKTCPELNVVAGPGGIEATTFVIPQMVLQDVDSVEDAVMMVNRFDVSDWGVYENRVPFLRKPGTGRTFVARSDDNGVNYTDAGLTGDDLFTGVVASYTDPTGRTLTVGPPGSGCDTQTAALSNSAANALTRHGRTRVGKISISTTAVERDVIQTAARWLTEKNLLETRGDVEVSGTIRDIAGVDCPVAEIKAGDQIIFPDREWKTRRIVEESYDGDTDTSSLSLDAMPSKIDALMERMGVENEAANV